MGIRFVCHLCSFALHVKDFQAGKRGKCPNCNGSFRIPDTDTSYSSALVDSSENPAVAKIRDAFTKEVKTKTTKRSKKSSGSISIALESSSDATSEVQMVPKVAGDVSANMPSNAVSKSSGPAVSMPTGPAMAMPTVLANAIDARWFVRPPSGGQFGPASSQMLMNWIAESRVTADSFLWRDGLAQWQLTSELLPELFVPEKSSIATTSSNTSAQSNEVSLNGSSSIRSAAVLKKRMHKRRQQVRTVILLATISLVLLSILIFVLVFQVAKPPQVG